MTREEAIEVLENGEWWEELTEWYMVVNPEHNKLHDAVDMAISALRKQGNSIEIEAIKPLTLDELREMDGEPVWVVYGEDEGMWALVEVCEESIFLTNNLVGRTEYADDVELEDDGLTVYLQKPEEGTE